MFEKSNKAKIEKDLATRLKMKKVKVEEKDGKYKFFIDKTVLVEFQWTEEQVLENMEAIEKSLVSAHKLK